jgi:hypothetical protein
VFRGQNIVSVNAAELGDSGDDKGRSRFVIDVARSILGDLEDLGRIHTPEEASIAVEVHNYPASNTPSIVNYRRARWMEGRIIQQLMCDHPLEVPASSESKARRRRRIELKHGDWFSSRRRHTEDEIDAVAVADDAYAILLVDEIRKKATPA